MRFPTALFLLLLPAAASAAWSPQGARLTGAAGDEFVALVSPDGTGGAFVGWTHLVPGTTDYECYLQHVTAAGEIAPGWPLDGLIVSGGPGGQGPLALQPEGSGGVLVLVADNVSGATDLYLQRVTAAGDIHPGWPAGGVPIVVAPGVQSDASMVGDGVGGAWISWYDRRDPTQIGGYYTHVLASGEIAAGWPENGRVYEPGLARTVLPTGLLPSADGGFLACIGATNGANFGVSAAIFARRHGPDGEPSSLWPVDATVVCPELVSGRGGGPIAPDAASGFFTVWEDYRNWPPYYNDPDLYAQHIRGDGTRAPGWPADGLAVAVFPGITQQGVTLCEDGAGGVYIAWEDYREGYARVYGQHLGPDGTTYPGWPAGGRPLSGLATWQLSPHLVWDGALGAYMAWMSFGAGGYLTYVSKLTPLGAPAPGWAPEGVRVSTLPNDHYRPCLAADGEGGAIVAWEQSASGGADIWAQRFMRDGIVAATVSLVAAEATPGEVRLLWRVSGARSATLERRAGEGAWEVHATLDADAEGNVAFTDREVTAGTTYEYRLAFADGTRGGLASVAVPLAYALALEGARPNPARGAPQVAFTLPDGAPAQLALYDLAGRRLTTRDVGTRGAGRHLVRLEGGALAPGLYWAALTHGGRTLRARVAIVE